MSLDAGVELRQQSGPQRLGSGGVDKVIGKLCPGIDLEQEFTEFDAAEGER